MISWLLLTYKLPVHPSALRVSIWRKLKRVGAILLNDTIWVLPDTSRTAENFLWLATEIQDRGGTAILWRSSLVVGLKEEDLIRQFKKQVDQEFKSLLKRLAKRNPDVAKLSQEYQQVIGKDYFRSEAGQQVKTKLLELREKTR